MTKTFTPKTILLTLLTFSFLFAQSFAQQPQQKDKKVKITINKTENGKTTVIEEEITDDGSISVDEILKKYGVDQELGTVGDGEEVEIIIRKKQDGNATKDIVIEVDPELEDGFWTDHYENKVEKKAFLGVKYDMLDAEKAQELGLSVTEGARVQEIYEDTPAEKAGLKAGDILLKAGGTELKTVGDLAEIVSGKKPGEELTIEYLRDGRQKTETVTLGEREVPTQERSRIYMRRHQGHHGDHAPRNLKVFPFEEDGDFEIRRIEDKPFLGVFLHSKSTGGAQITGTIDNSTAEGMGLQKGDVITAINGKPVNSHRDATQAIQAMKVGAPITVEYTRDGEQKTATAPIKAHEVRVSKDCIELFERNHGDKQGMQWFQDEHEGDFNVFLEDLKQSLNEDGEVTKEIRVVIATDDISEQEAEAIRKNSGEDFTAQNSLELESLELYPNPSAGQFTVGFDLPQKGNTSIRVYDMRGEVVFSEDLAAFQGKYEKRIDLTGQSRGVYFLNVIQNGKSFSRKIVTR